MEIPPFFIKPIYIYINYLKLFIMSSILQPTRVASTVAAGGTAVAVLSQFAIRPVRADSVEAPPKMFGGGPAFVSLPLESAEMVNHNTKRLRFSFPNKEAVSGLPLTCKFIVGADHLSVWKSFMGLIW